MGQPGVVLCTSSYEVKGNHLWTRAQWVNLIHADALLVSGTFSGHFRRRFISIATVTIEKGRNPTRCHRTFSLKVSIEMSMESSPSLWPWWLLWQNRQNPRMNASFTYSTCFLSIVQYDHSPSMRSSAIDISSTVTALHLTSSITYC